MTAPNEYFLNRQIQMALYSLKRQYGGDIDVYKVGESVSDPKTGRVHGEIDVTHVRRAIILPTKVSHDVQRNISIISTNKMMVGGGSGGAFEAGKRVFIIDRRDARDLQLTENDFIGYRGRKYQIEKLEEYEFDAAWVVTGKYLAGEALPVLLQAGASSQIVLRDDGGEA